MERLIPRIREIARNIHRTESKRKTLAGFLREVGEETEILTRLEPDRLPRAASDLLEELTRLQAAGDPSELAAFSESYGRPPAELVTAVEGMADLPIDILPTFPLD